MRSATHSGTSPTENRLFYHFILLVTVDAAGSTPLAMSLAHAGAVIFCADTNPLIH